MPEAGSLIAHYSKRGLEGGGSREKGRWVGGLSDGLGCGGKRMKLQMRLGVLLI